MLDRHRAPVAPRTPDFWNRDVCCHHTESNALPTELRDRLYIFDMFYVISQPFLKISTWNCVHIFMRHCPLPCVTFFLLKILILGENVSKRKKVDIFLNFFRYFKFFENQRYSFIALLIIRHKSIDRSLKTAPVAAIPVNLFCWSKSAKHNVTLTSLTADLLWPGS